MPKLNFDKGLALTGSATDKVLSATVVSPTPIANVSDYEAFMVKRELDDSISQGSVDVFDLSGRVNAKALGVAGDGTTDDHARLQALATICDERGYPLFLGRGQFVVSAGLEITNRFIFEGAARGTTVVRLVGSTPSDVVRVLGLNKGGSPNGGAIRNMTVRGLSASDTGKAAVIVDEVKDYTVDDVETRDSDIGFDLRNNCYGTKFRGIRAVADYLKVGVLMRGSTGYTAGSGSDIPMDGPWIGGEKAAVWIEGGAGAYTITNGQLAGGPKLPQENDLYGSVLTNLTYDYVTTLAADAASGATTLNLVNASAVASSGIIMLDNGVDVSLAEYTGRNTTTNQLTGVSWPYGQRALTAGTGVRLRGSVGKITLNSASFEGSSKRSAIRQWGRLIGLASFNSSFNSNGTNRMKHVLKATRGEILQAQFIGTKVDGTWTGSKPMQLDLAPYYGPDSYVYEVGTQTDSPGYVTFNGVKYNLNQKLMIEDAGLGKRGAGICSEYQWISGKAVRMSGSNMEWTATPSDSSSWKKVRAWENMTPSDYAALTTPDPETIYFVDKA